MPYSVLFAKDRINTVDFNRLFISARIRLREFPLKVVNDVVVQPDENWKIPNVCYQTWVNKKFGKSHRKEIKKFRDMNQEVSFVLYDEDQLNSYMFDSWSHHPIYHIFKDSKFGPMRADIFRYCILYDKGGYYFDISKGCVNPIRFMHESNCEAFLSFENNSHEFEVPGEVSELLDYPNNLIIQWGFGFVKGHPILKQVIDLIVSNEKKFRGNVYTDPKEAILSFTGPRSFTKAVHEVIASKICGEVTQAGVDFNGSGRYALTGSYVRYFTRTHYTEFSNLPIL